MDPQWCPPTETHPKYGKLDRIACAPVEHSTQTRLDASWLPALAGSRWPAEPPVPAAHGSDAAPLLSEATDITHFDLAPSGVRLCTAHDDPHGVAMWDLVTLRQLWRTPVAAVFPNHRGSAEGEEAQSERRLRKDPWRTVCAFDPGGDYLAVGHQNQLAHLDVCTGRAVAIATIHDDRDRSVLPEYHLRFDFCWLGIGWTSSGESLLAYMMVEPEDRIYSHASFVTFSRRELLERNPNGEILTPRNEYISGGDGIEAYEYLFEHLKPRYSFALSNDQRVLFDLPARTFHVDWAGRDPERHVANDIIGSHLISSDCLGTAMAWTPDDFVVLVAANDHVLAVEPSLRESLFGWRAGGTVRSIAFARNEMVATLGVTNEAGVHRLEWRTVNRGELLASCEFDPPATQPPHGINGIRQLRYDETSRFLYALIDGAIRILHAPTQRVLL